jgi:hypothetical protein
MIKLKKRCCHCNIIQYKSKISINTIFIYFKFFKLHVSILHMDNIQVSYKNDMQKLKDALYVIQKINTKLGLKYTIAGLKVILKRQ